jgi:hypothetical protein
MDKSVKGSFGICVTVIVSISIFTYGIICFGQSLERSCDNIKDGMRGASKMHIPSTINLKVNSSSIEKASANIRDGLRGVPTTNIPSTISLDLRSGRSQSLNVNMQ